MKSKKPNRYEYASKFYMYLLRWNPKTLPKKTPLILLHRLIQLLSYLFSDFIESL